MPNIYYIVGLVYLMGVTTGLIIATIRDGKKMKKIERVNLPDYDPHNPINGNIDPKDVIHTEYGDLYRIHPGV